MTEYYIAYEHLPQSVIPKYSSAYGSILCVCVLMHAWVCA